MGIFSSISNFLTHDVFDPINNALGGGAGQNLNGDPAAAAVAAQTDATKAATAQAAADAAKALKAQQDANLISASASLPFSDNEGGRSAADAQRRRLMQGSNFGIGLPDKFGAPPVGYRMLSGQ